MIEYKRKIYNSNIMTGGTKNNIIKFIKYSNFQTIQNSLLEILYNRINVLCFIHQQP